MENQNQRDEDRKNFVRLATKRVNNALKYMRLVGNLSNTTNYFYKDEDIEKIFKALQSGLDECKKKFESKKKERENFTLD